MQKIILLIVLASTLKFNSAKAQTLDSLLRNFPLVNYLNKPIDTLIAHLPVGFDTTFIISDNGNVNKGASLQISYQPNFAYWIDIGITDAQFITIVKEFNTSPDIAWPLHLLRKEKIGRIRIFTGAYEIINEKSIN